MNISSQVNALAAYIFQLMMLLTPVKEHNYYESVQATVIRYTTVAATLAGVMVEQNMPDAERLKIAAVMVSIGDAESHWNADVVSCKKGGDHERAWGPWQTQLPKDKVCASTKEAARLALGMVKTSLLTCKHLKASDRLSWYTDGRCIADWKRSQWRMGRALTYVAQHPLRYELLVTDAE